MKIQEYMLQQMGVTEIGVDKLFNEAFSWSEEAVQSFGQDKVD